MEFPFPPPLPPEGVPSPPEEELEPKHSSLWVPTAAQDLRVKIAGEMALRGCNWKEIKDRLGLPSEKHAVSLVNLARVHWERRFKTTLENRMAEELRHLEHAREQYLDAWEKSKKDTVHKERTIEIPAFVPQVGADNHIGVPPVIRNRRTIRRTVKQNIGDTRYLDGAVQVSAEIRKLMGLDAPAVQKIIVDGDVRHSGDLSFEHLLKLDPTELKQLHSQALAESATPKQEP